MIHGCASLSSQDGFNASVVPLGGLSGAAVFTVLKLSVQEWSTQMAFAKACVAPIAQSLVHADDKVLRRKDSTSTRVQVVKATWVRLACATTPRSSPPVAALHWPTGGFLSAAIGFYLTVGKIVFGAVVHWVVLFEAGQMWVRSLRHRAGKWGPPVRHWELLGSWCPCTACCHASPAAWLLFLQVQPSCGVLRVVKGAEEGGRGCLNNGVQSGQHRLLRRESGCSSVSYGFFLGHWRRGNLGLIATLPVQHLQPRCL